MSVKINGTEYHGIFGLLLAIPIIIFTFAVIAIVFLGVIFVLLSPLIALVWLISLVV